MQVLVPFGLRSKSAFCSQIQTVHHSTRETVLLRPALKRHTVPFGGIRKIEHISRVQLQTKAATVYFQIS